MDWLCNTVLPGLLTLHNSHVYFIPGVFIDGCVHTLGFGASIGSTLHSSVFFYSLLALFLFWRLYAGRSILHYRPFFFILGHHSNVDMMHTITMLVVSRRRPPSIQQTVIYLVAQMFQCDDVRPRPSHGSHAQVSGELPI